MKKRTIRKTARIYYGPPGAETSMYWTVAVTDARREVTVDGTVAAALKANPGETVGCALSNIGMDSAKNFDHPVYFVSVTASTVLVVDKLSKNGTPVHAMRYGHGYHKLIEANDNGTLKELVKTTPELIERPFVLRAPRKRPTGPHAGHKRVATPGAGQHTLHLHGALKRAVKANRISAAVADQLSRAMSRRKHATQ